MSRVRWGNFARAYSRTARNVLRTLSFSSSVTAPRMSSRRSVPPVGQAGGTLRRDDILGAVTDELKDSVRNTFLAVREYARAKFPHRTRDILDYNYCYKVTKEDEPSSGVSAGIPTGLAFL